VMDLDSNRAHSKHKLLLLLLLLLLQLVQLCLLVACALNMHETVLI